MQNKGEQVVWTRFRKSKYGDVAVKVIKDKGLIVVKPHKKTKNPEIKSMDYYRWRDLAEFFESIKNNKYFHPHPFTKKKALELGQYRGHDSYYILIKDKIIGYGFLRGWDRDWEDKCLGIVIGPDEQGHGYGRLMMNHLHSVARKRGLQKIRLHVSPENKGAISLYKSMGYKEEGKRENGEFIYYYNCRSK